MSEMRSYRVRIIEVDGERVVAVAGEIDLYARAELVMAISQAAISGQRLVIDLSETTFIDSTAVKALLDAWRHQAAAGKELVLRDPTPAVMRVLEMTGLTDLLHLDLNDGQDR